MICMNGRKIHARLLIAIMLSCLSGLLFIQMFVPKQLVQMVNYTSNMSCGEFPFVEKDKNEVSDSFSIRLGLKSIQKDLLSILNLTDKQKSNEQANGGFNMAMMSENFKSYDKTNKTKNRIGANDKKSHFDMQSALFKNIEYLTNQIYQRLETNCTCYSTNISFTRNGWLCKKDVCFEPKMDNCKPTLNGRQTTNMKSVSIE